MITLLLADDDPDDRLLAGDALEERGASVDLQCVLPGQGRRAPAREERRRMSPAYEEPPRAGPGARSS